MVRGSHKQGPCLHSARLNAIDQVPVRQVSSYNMNDILLCLVSGLERCGHQFVPDEGKDSNNEQSRGMKIR